MAYIRCVGGSGGSIQKKTATGAVATFNTGLPVPLIDVTSAIGYRSNGYTSASCINSKTTPVIDETPYQTRIAPSNIGNMALEKLVGLTVCFNQLQANTLSRTNNGVTYTFNNGELSIVTAEGGATATSWWLTGSDTKWEWIANHVYLVIVGNPNYTYSGGAYPNWYIPTSPQTTLLKNETIFKPTANATTYMQFTISTGNELNTKYKPQVFDLTAMFGSEVADYLYTLESGTAGSGVALFKSLFGEDYYPYTANTLMSAKPTGKKIVGFNQWDEEWELGEIKYSDGTNSPSSSYWRTKNYIPIFPNTAYYIYSPDGQYPRARFYDSEKNYIGAEDKSGTDIIFNSPFTTKENAYFLRFAPETSVSHIACVNISDASKNGTYEPYSETTIVYSGNELRGLLKVGTNGLYADGDTDDGSGTGSVRYGIVDLGSLDWTYYEYGLISGGYSTSLSTQLKQGTGGDALYNAISVLTQYTDDTFETSPDLTFAINYYGYVKAHVSGVTDSASLKSALSGKYLIYELATPTTQTISAWTNPIVAKEGGTEEFIDGNFYARVDLGSLNWQKATSQASGKTYFQTVDEVADMIKSTGNSYIQPIFCSDYTTETWVNCLDRTGYDNSIASGWAGKSYVVIYDNSKSDLDATSFKNAMSGKYLTYEISNSTLELPTGHSTIHGTDLSVKKAEFGTTVFGGSVDFTTGEVISNKNADGTDKTPETISVTPVDIDAFSGANNVMSDTNGNSTVQFLDYRS